MGVRHHPSRHHDRKMTHWSARTYPTVQGHPPLGSDDSVSDVRRGRISRLFVLIPALARQIPRQGLRGRRVHGQFPRVESQAETLTVRRGAEILFDRSESPVLSRENMTPSVSPDIPHRRPLAQANWHRE